MSFISLIYSSSGININYMYHSVYTVNLLKGKIKCFKHYIKKKREAETIM